MPSAGVLDWWAWIEAMCVPAGLDLLLMPPLILLALLLHGLSADAVRSSIISRTRY